MVAAACDGGGRGEGDGDGDGDGAGDGDGGGDGTGVGDGDVLARLVKPQGKQMKPSYKFRWREGDQYAYCWAMGDGMVMAPGTAREMEWEAETETYWRIWSSRRVST